VDDKNMIEKMKNDKHITVLLDEAVDALNVHEGDVVVDATLGAGGHTLKILEKVGKTGKVMAFDLDIEAINEFKAIVERDYPEFRERLIFVNDNFKNIEEVIKKDYARGGIDFNKVDAILADLGWRIEQVQDKRYGMSFQSEMPLDMRMSPETQKLTAKEIVNEWSEEELGNIFRELGGEKYFDAKKIAKKIIDSREEIVIETTTQLVRIIEKVKTAGKTGMNPATKVFQALRITVNKELSSLDIFLKSSFDVLKNKGRLAIISFHSLEDRLVKRFFRAKARGCVCPKEIPVCVCQKERQAKIIQRKTIKESKEILKDNPRARSARMRILEKK
jgi:16S rRNA (cytosine1402-N4)-methyltransferase